MSARDITTTLTVRFKICRNYLTMVGVHATKEGRKKESEEFYETLQKKYINGTEQTTSL